ncbi:MAG: SxtJ family membrane protein [Lysobacterales bacterium]
MTDRTSGHAIPELDSKGLRNFALSTGAVFVALFGMFFPWLLDRSYPVWPWVVFAILALVGLLLPEYLRPVHYWWMRLALLISKVTTPIVLGVVFFFVFVPFGLVAKILGKDPMKRKLDDTIDSYRVDSEPSAREDLENPY